MFNCGIAEHLYKVIYRNILLNERYVLLMTYINNL